MYCRILLFFVGIFLLINSGCGGNAVQQARSEVDLPASAAGAAFDFPAPDTLVADLPELPRRTSYVETDLIKHGSQFDVDEARQLVAPADHSVSLTPAWTGPSGLAGAAYCTYFFYVPGYDRESVVQMQWASPPPNAANVYIGLSRWSSRSWDWFQYTGADLAPPSLDPYINDSDVLLLVVLSIGSEEDCLLRWVRLGVMPPVEVVLTASAEDGVAPLGVDFASVGSSAGVGDITGNEWDFDGDGEFDTDTGTGQFIFHQYETAGSYSAALRITTSYDVQAVGEVEILARPSWAHTLGKTDSERFVAIAADDQFVYFAGYTESWGNGPTNVLVVQYNLAGEFQWARAWGNSDKAEILDLAIDSLGHLYALGQIDTVEPAVDYRLLIMQWSPSGDLLLSKSWESPYGNSWQQVTMVGNSIYAIGNTSLATGEAILAKFDSHGALQWAKQFGSALRDVGVALAAVNFGETGDKIHTACRHTYDGSLDSVMYCRFDADGNAEDTRVWVTATDDLHPNAICVANTPLHEVFIAGDDWINKTQFLIQQQDAGSTVARYLDGGAGGDLLTRGICAVGNFLQLCSQDDTGVVLALMTTNGNLISDSKYLGAEGAIVSMNICSAFDRGLFITGYAHDGPGGSWSDPPLTAGSLTGSWEPVLVTIGDISGVAGTEEGTVVDITDAIHDGQVGNYDAFGMLAPVP